jgi:excinuclease ABC subunit C
MSFDPKKISDFSTEPGVYLMKNKRGTILYVGKANNIRQRVKQYFVSGGDGRPMIPFLIAHVEAIDTIVVHSEKEALLLENNLIKLHKPKYNALLKDDKSYIALKLTKHVWPRIDLVRYHGKPKPDGTYFGPYTSAYAARKTLDLLQRIFPLRQCSDQEFSHRTRPCILYDIKRCVAPCVNFCTKEEYDELVKKSAKFLRGQDTEVVQELHKQMQRHSEALEFEKAGAIWNTISLIEKTVEGQNVDKPMGVDADALGIFREGEEVSVSQLQFRHGRLMDARHYQFSQIAQDDCELLHSFILQQYVENELIPHEILIPVELPESAVLEDILSQNRSRRVLILSPQRGDKKAIIQMAHANAEATFKKEKDSRAIRERTLLEMQEKFHLTRYPRRIECFDISNISGTDNVASLVAFTEGQKDSKRYRKYKIKGVVSMDDYSSMFEVLMRRFTRAQEENDLPDLLIVDGGKGHLNVALRVMDELNIITVDVISIAKEEGRHDRGMTLETVFLPEIKDPIHFKKNSSILFFLQQIRDEAHRFAITFLRKRRSKAQVKSALDDIPGIGPSKKRNLIKHFGDVKAIRNSTVDEIAKVKGISQKDAENILRILNIPT